MGTWTRYSLAVLKVNGTIDAKEAKAFDTDYNLITAPSADPSNKKVKEAMVRLTLLIGDIKLRPDNVRLEKMIEPCGRIRVGTNASPQAWEQRRDLLDRLYAIADPSVPESDLDLNNFEQKTIYSKV